MVECLTPDPGAAGLSRIGVTALWSWSKTHFLVLVQPRKTKSWLTERLLMVRKESNQTKTKENEGKATVSTNYSLSS